MGPFPYLFQLVEAVCMHWLSAPSSIFDASNSKPDAFNTAVSLVSLPSDILKGPSDYIGPSWLIQGNLPA